MPDGFLFVPQFDFTFWPLVLLVAATVGTSLISAVLGGVGGVLQLSVMSFFYSYGPLVPLHGFIQLFSNSSRFSFLKAHIKREFAIPFVVGVCIGGFFSYFAVKEIKSHFLPNLFISMLILYVLFKPKKMPELRIPAKYYIFLGMLSGFAGPIIAAGGPLISIFVFRSDWKKEQVIANQAVFQASAHLIKIPVFLALGFNYVEHAATIGVLLLAVWLGTRLGVRLLEKINEKWFWILLRAALTGAVARLLFVAFSE